MRETYRHTESSYKEERRQNEMIVIEIVSGSFGLRLPVRHEREDSRTVLLRSWGLTDEGSYYRMLLPSSFFILH